MAPMTFHPLDKGGVGPVGDRGAFRLTGHPPRRADGSAECGVDSEAPLVTCHVVHASAGALGAAALPPTGTSDGASHPSPARPAEMSGQMTSFPQSWRSDPRHFCHNGRIPTSPHAPSRAGMASPAATQELVYIAPAPGLAGLCCWRQQEWCSRLRARIRHGEPRVERSH